MLFFVGGRDVTAVGSGEREGFRLGAVGRAETGEGLGTLGGALGGALGAALGAPKGEGAPWGAADGEPKGDGLPLGGAEGPPAGNVGAPGPTRSCAGLDGRPSSGLS